ncbi:MAG: thiamine pyridinylase [Proteobacteria bacterium]|nr:thiamine pyridinylase [Pseudomonadota bacterium]
MEVIDASYDVEAAEDLAHRYTTAPSLPTAAELDPGIMAQLRTMLAMTSAKHAKYYSEDSPYQRAIWFGQGLGRATVGFTESMSVMGPARNTVSFKPFPMDGLPDVTLFYSDLVGINSKVIDPDKRAAAIELANLLASPDFLTASFGPSPDAPVPQYLMPVRKSVFQRLAAKFPLYGQMYTMATTVQPRLFRLGPGSRPWLEGTKSSIRAEVFEAPICQP